jgi:1-acyl-sn-glycerol-3-phosphate acyltransferase
MSKRIDRNPKTGEPILEEESRANPRTHHGLIFYPLYAIVVSLAWILYRPRVYGRRHIPREGSFVLASNHSHNFDPAIYYATLPRHIFFLGKDSLFRFPLGILARRLGVIPIDRSRRNRNSLHFAIDKLRQGRAIVGIFPEGTVTGRGPLREFRLGAVKMAHEANVPIVPAAITADYNPLRRDIITYGAPIHVGDDLEAANRELRETIIQLRRQHRRKS